MLDCSKKYMRKSLEIALLGASLLPIFSLNAYGAEKDPSRLSIDTLFSMSTHSEKAATNEKKGSNFKLVESASYKLNNSLDMILKLEAERTSQSIYGGNGNKAGEDNATALDLSVPIGCNFGEKIYSLRAGPVVYLTFANAKQDIITTDYQRTAYGLEFGGSVSKSLGRLSLLGDVYFRRAFLGDYSSKARINLPTSAITVDNKGKSPGSELGVSLGGNFRKGDFMIKYKDESRRNPAVQNIKEIETRVGYRIFEHLGLFVKHKIGKVESQNIKIDVNELGGGLEIPFLR